VLTGPLLALAGLRAPAEAGQTAAGGSLLEHLGNVGLLDALLEAAKVPDDGQEGGGQRLDAVDELAHGNVAELLARLVGGDEEAEAGLLQLVDHLARVLPVWIDGRDHFQAVLCVHWPAIAREVAHDFFDET